MICKLLCFDALYYLLALLRIRWRRSEEPLRRHDVDDESLPVAVSEIGICPDS